MVTSNRLWLVLPAWLCIAADISLTLAGQSDAYWGGNYEAVVEYNALARPILIAGPWVLVLVAASWAVLLGVLVACFSHRLITWLIVVAAVAHAAGGSSWIARCGNWGWAFAILYLCVASEFSWWCWRRSGWIANKKDAQPEGGEECC